MEEFLVIKPVKNRDDQNGLILIFMCLSSQANAKVTNSESEFKVKKKTQKMNQKHSDAVAVSSKEVM